MQPVFLSSCLQNFAHHYPLFCKHQLNSSSKKRACAFFKAITRSSKRRAGWLADQLCMSQTLCVIEPGKLERLSSMAELNYGIKFCQFIHLNYIQTVTLAKGNEITGCDSTDLDGQCGQLLKRGLIIFQSSQFILQKNK